MGKLATQPGLFDAISTVDATESAYARARMQTMIDRLRGTDEFPWKDRMAEILDDGCFVRAMRLVPDDEAQALWAEYDAQAERLHAILQASCEA